METWRNKRRFRTATPTAPAAPAAPSLLLQLLLLLLLLPRAPASRPPPTPRIRSTMTRTSARDSITPYLCTLLLATLRLDAALADGVLLPLTSLSPLLLPPALSLLNSSRALELIPPPAPARDASGGSSCCC
jgi:hypothetical protein